jgi:hypothetical protein
MSTDAAPLVGRVIALGASNLTRGLHVVLSTSRSTWGANVELVAALGLGRSYGLRSRVLARSLPSILECGLWPALEHLPPRASRALITDVGNDILYGASVSQILSWVEECVTRLQPFTRDVVLSGLPLDRIRRVSRSTFPVLRQLLAPRCSLSLAQVLDRAECVMQGLEQLATKHSTRFVRLRPEWYGLDPIHVRRRFWRLAWPEMLCVQTPSGAPARSTWTEIVRLQSLLPERQWLLSVAQITPQRGVQLMGGGRVWLY